MQGIQHSHAQFLVFSAVVLRFLAFIHVDLSVIVFGTGDEKDLVAMRDVEGVGDCDGASFYMVFPDEFRGPQLIKLVHDFLASDLDEALRQSVLRI